MANGRMCLVIMLHTNSDDVQAQRAIANWTHTQEADNSFKYATVSQALLWA